MWGPFGLVLFFVFFPFYWWCFICLWRFVLCKFSDFIWVLILMKTIIIKKGRKNVSKIPWLARVIFFFLKNKEINPFSLPLWYLKLPQNESWNLINILFFFFFYMHIALILAEAQTLVSYLFYYFILLCLLVLIQFLFPEWRVNVLSLGKNIFKLKSMPKKIKILNCNISLLVTT